MYANLKTANPSTKIVIFSQIKSFKTWGTKKKRNEFEENKKRVFWTWHQRLKQNRSTEPKRKNPRNFFFLEDQTSPRATKNKTKIVSKHKKLSVSEQTFWKVTTFLWRTLSFLLQTTVNVKSSLKSLNFSHTLKLENVGFFCERTAPLLGQKNCGKLLKKSSDDLH